MSEKVILVIYLLVYILAIIYLVVLGCYMLAQRGSMLSTRGELEAKLRMTRTMGIAMFIWAFLLFIYLPPLLLQCEFDHPIFKLLFIFSLMVLTPMAYVMMFAVMQRQFCPLKWCSILSAPFLVLVVWQLLTLSSASNIPVYAAAVLGVVSNIFMLIWFAREYRIYTRRLRSEYSEITSREIFWAWICFSGLAMQGILYVVYVLVWTPTGEVLYFILSLVNATALCFCICHQHTIDLDVVEEVVPEPDIDDKAAEKAFYADIEQKLKTLCEDKLLFLEPELTRETLSLRLAINRTYLSMYFRHCGTTYYQYINTLRVEHAVKLIQENPDIPINDVSEQSGFRTQTTFRRAFQEVMGCLPSEVRNK